MLNVVLWMIILNEQSFNNISRYILKKYFLINIFLKDLFMFINLYFYLKIFMEK